MIAKMQKIIEYGLYLLVFLLPIQTRWIIKAGELNGGYWEYGTVSLYATDVLLIGLLVLFVVGKIKNYSSKFSIFNFQFSIYWYLIAGLELMVFISIFVALDKLVAGYCYARLLLGIGLFWLIISANFSKTKLIMSLSLGIVGQALLGIWQFLMQASFSCKWLGIAEHKASDLGVSVVETLAGGRWLRAYGGLDHPNILGGLLAAGIIITLVLIITNSNYLPCFSLRQKGWQPVKILYYLFLIFFIMALFFTFSRGAWVGLMAGILVLLIIAIIKRELLGRQKLLEIILILSVLILIVFNMFNNLISTRLSNSTRLEQKSNVGRMESYKIAQTIIKNHWLLGAGIGNYTLVVQREIINNQPSYFYQPVHNVFLLIWAEIGVIGLLFFISILFFIFYFLFFIKNREGRSNLNIYDLSILIALLVMFLVDHWWWSLHFGVLFLWLILGLIIRDYKNNY